MKLRFAQSAEADLDSIARWIAQDNPVRALSFLLERKEVCLPLADFPDICPLVPRYETSGVRRKVHGNYVIFYVHDERAVTVIHILHGARNYEDILFGVGQAD